MGATKHSAGKPQLSLLPKVFLEQVARAFELGQAKYGRYNYHKGFETSKLIDAMLRHITAYNDGQDSDPESGYSHLGHAGACIAMLLKCEELGTLEDDRKPSAATEKELRISLWDAIQVEECSCVLSYVYGAEQRWGNHNCPTHGDKKEGST